MNAKIWAQFLERLKEQVNDRCLAYIENLSCQGMTDETWNLCLPNRSMLNFVESNLDGTLREVLHSVMCDAGMADVSIVYSIENELEPVSKRESGYLPFDPVTVISSVFGLVLIPMLPLIYCSIISSYDYC